MFLRFPWQHAIVRMSEAGSGEGGGEPPPPPPRQPQQRQADPPPPPAEGGSRRPTEAELRAEAAANRVARQQAEEAGERTRQQLTEAQAAADRRVQEEAAKYTPKITKLQGTLVNAELRAAAAAEGLVDMDLLHLPALDRSKITVDDDGNVTGVAEALAAFKSAKPNYFRAAGGAAASGTAAGGAAGGAAAGTGAAAGGAATGGAQQSRSTGSPTTPPPDGTNTPVDVTKMTKAEYADYRRGMQRRLQGR
jgi:hypothetical protein